MSEWKNILKKPKDLKLFIIHTGFVHMAGNIHVNRKSSKFKSFPKDDRFNPVFAYLVEHPEQGYLLLDTGLHSSFSQSRFGNFGFLLGGVVKTKTEAGMDVVSRLGSINVAPQKISKIVLSHLHLDHTSGLPHFKDNGDLKVYIDPDEIDSGEALFGLFKGYIKKQRQGMRIEPIAYSKNAPPFIHAWDVFHDQSVFIVRTPGHTPGHVSALLNMSGGPLFLTFDVAHRKVNIDETIPTKGDYDQSMASIEAFKVFLKIAPETRVIYGHDPDQLGSLKLLPDYYT
ncbi:MAG TPA: MBL fold metallo-hydrolase [Deltaproteobacteria bacterium]|jgi:glyoxylase-like metal-dependent hydrolase (beta-lactamase superfamily II)|nr:MBL fold metallo-hydrolase [Deltaproteobacteria bacterium]HQI01927.1 MBL fold metallo-hydrolase [Deltaproteobacteria bacterium]HQJ08425.1 MBL fold metallo-hydrolase [Deltaproteobacteria bacterium]